LSPSLSDKQVDGIEGKMQAEGEVVQLPVAIHSPDGTRIAYRDSDTRPDTEGPGSQVVAGPSVLQSDGGSRPTF
jgi:hypothetical protein